MPTPHSPELHARKCDIEELGGQRTHLRIAYTDTAHPFGLVEFRLGLQCFRASCGVRRRCSRE
jgi:hypothetical protein